ncbi:restriction endonuclease subunit S [Pseudomonas carnis]|uniref:restriction endonuclease subunit S n=1 Tax=Pseudomonas carnis TaxID=2487355 RepID=UPI0021CA1323|nr:restriction endonuclease subunit S [Pseudomonas carnis]MCR8665444.1 restriction endonuclease subunit S [Pseudomonas carnis]
MSEQGYQPLTLRNAVAGHLGGGTPSRQVPSYWRGQIPWASVKDFPEQSRIIEDTEEHISTSGLNASASNLIPAGTPLVCTRMAVGRATMSSVPMAINQDVKALFPAPGVSSAYLLKLLQFIQPKAEAQAVGSTVKGIRTQDYLDIEAPIADTDAQPVIALVLNTLDTAIHETQAIIAKLKAVKLGLLHDLLTRGIDANGELRPPQSEAPDLYKKTDQGWIPLSWDVRPLSEYTSSEITYGIVQAGPHIPNGVPYIRTGDMSGDSLVREAMLCTSRRIAGSYTRSEVRTGDIVMAIRATVGKVLSVPSTLEGANLTQGTAKISPNASTDESFLLWAIRHSRSQRAIQLEVKGTTFAEITLGALRQVPIAAPVKINEQREIGKRLAAIDMQLQSEQQYLAKARAKKSGLMDDLLTGRVRVTPLLAEIAQQKGSA